MPSFGLDPFHVTTDSSTPQQESNYVINKMLLIWCVHTQRIQIVVPPTPQHFHQSHPVRFYNSTAPQGGHPIQITYLDTENYLLHNPQMF